MLFRGILRFTAAALIAGSVAAQQPFEENKYPAFAGQWLRVGPLGVFDGADGPACAMAAVRWALERAPSVAIDLPAMHPALRPLLDAGCRITYVELFMGDEFADTRRYLPSGSDLF